MSTAFGTRAGFGPDNVGSIAVGDSSYELHEELKKGGGVVVVDDDDTLLSSILDEHPALKRVAVARAEETVEKAHAKAERAEARQSESTEKETK